MSLDTRTERRQARQRRNLVIGGVAALASVLSVSLLVALLTGGADQPASAEQPNGPSTSAWTPTDDDVWSEAPSTTSVPTVTAPGLTAATGTPTATTPAAPQRTAVTVARTTSAPRPADPAPATPTTTMTTSPTSNVPPGQLKRPKPKTTPPPRR
ncbi:hypothetical protein FHX52_3213 [Humibacillus xanthopallidus]|uniref:Uncharacterized protein n=1 Tax=Humibacillus xanthopallidus TaxID=412689 RepID=A0A543PQY4_9MICO|nr:hypothetical protein [Humibacillus xanthopallidus]TQN46489.1 hypothetical protein FHX52_3213 [Humibacillus xanthopallidus]